MNLQVIEKEGKPEWAVIPYPDYLSLVEDAEMLQDLHDYDAAKLAILQGERLIPAEVTFQILDGESPIKVWREYLQMSPAQLAQAAGISQAELSRLESKAQEGTEDILIAIAKAFQLPVEEFI
jgi:DNA-binding XRE family transcriptional regulator